MARNLAGYCLAICLLLGCSETEELPDRDVPFDGFPPEGDELGCAPDDLGVDAEPGCPVTPPTHGESCSGNQACYYGWVSCFCSPGTTWHCISPYFDLAGDFAARD